MVTNKKEYMREYLKKYRQSPHYKEYRRDYMREYAQSPKYREYIKEYNKKYYQSHRQQILERQKRYHQSPKYKKYIREYYKKRQRYGLSHYPADIQMQYLDFLWDQVKKEVKEQDGK